jgi:hypothetical protein
LVLDGVISDLFVLVFRLLLFVLIFDTSAFGKVSAVGTDNSSDSLHEFWSLHDQSSCFVLTVNKTNVLGNGSGSDFVVSCDHSNLDSCFIALSDTGWYLFSNGVSDSKESDENEAVLFEIVNSSLVGGFEVAL